MGAEKNVVLEVRNVRNVLMTTNQRRPEDERVNVNMMDFTFNAVKTVIFKERSKTLLRLKFRCKCARAFIQN